MALSKPAIKLPKAAPTTKKTATTKKKSATKKKKEKTAAERTASAFSAIGPLVGLGGTIASAVPGLKKPQKSNVRVSSLPISQAAAGVAARGFGVNRGGMGVQAMRAAGRAGNLVASQRLAAESQNEINNINQTNARNERVAAFGRDTASGVADLGVGLLDAANARKAERLGASGASSGRVSDQDRVGGYQPGSTGAGIQKLLGGSQETLDGAVDPPQLEDLIKNPDVVQKDLVELYKEELTSIGNKQIQNRTEALAQSRAINGLGSMVGMYSIAPDLEYKNRLLNFSLDEVEKRGLSLQSSLAPLARMLNTDLTEILRPPVQMMDEDEDAAG